MKALPVGEQADRRFWESVSELRVQGWKLDDCIHEHTALRGELASLLAARPFVPKAFRGKRTGSGAGFGKGRGFVQEGRGKGRKGAKGKGGKGKDTWLRDWIPKARVGVPCQCQWWIKTLCMRYSQKNGCKNPSCRYDHLCLILLLFLAQQSHKQNKYCTHPPLFFKP